MKTNKFFAFAALVCGFAMSFTSCGNEDTPIVPSKTVTISFEGAALNADGYWCGDENGEKFDNWGSDAYACSYAEQGVAFPVNYTPAWGSWTGYAVSNRTETSYATATMTPDQFNNITGKAHSGNNFCVVYTFGETIDFEQPVTLHGFWYTNEAWTVDAILNGDGMSPGKFEESDWFKCTVTVTKADDTTENVDIYLAKDGDYVKTWMYKDFSNLGKIKTLSFNFDGSKKNDWGVTTPTYICIDDIEIEK